MDRTEACESAVSQIAFAVSPLPGVSAGHSACLILVERGVRRVERTMRGRGLRGCFLATNMRKSRKSWHSLSALSSIPEFTSDAMANHPTLAAPIHPIF